MVRRRWLLLGAASLIAGAGVAYELSLMLLGTVTVGSTEQANAVVLGTAMFGMGIGAAGGGRLARNPVRNFVAVESVLAVLGAAAAPFLYWTWARLDAFWGPLLGVAVVIGVCIGAEMPLLAAINDKLSRQTAAEVVSEYTAADYFGALIGAVAFAFLVRPKLGIVNGTIAIAVLNLLVAVAVAFVLPGVARRRLVFVAPALGAVGLVVVATLAGPVVRDGRQALFRDPIVLATDTGLQEVVITERTYFDGRHDVRLFLDGDLQLSSLDEYRYHEALVHPAIAPDGGEVLVLGGGDCLAVREILRHPDVERVTLVELDAEVTEIVGNTPALAAIGGDSCSDERVTVVNDDAFTWVGDQRDSDASYDTVIVDFPDPDTVALGRLYSLEMYGQIAAVMAPGGQMVVQCGSPFFAPEAYWTCAETLETAGWSTVPYHVDVPSFGDWGFHLAALGSAPSPRFDPVEGLRFLTPEVLMAAQVFPPDLARAGFEVRPSSILDPTIVEAARGAWRGY